MFTVGIILICHPSIIIIVKYTNTAFCIKLKGEVGMAVPKSTQTRVVGINTYMVHPYACFSHYDAMSCVDVFINIMLLTCKPTAYIPVSPASYQEVSEEKEQEFW